jgi:hypothetical protein
MRTRVLIEKLNRMESDINDAATSSVATNFIAAGAASGFIGAWFAGTSFISGVGAGLVVGGVMAGLSSCFFACRKKTPGFAEAKDDNYIALDIQSNNP